VTPWLLVPVKALAHGKSRLSAVLQPASRHALNAFFLRRTLANTRAFPGAGRALFVTDCEQVRGLAAAAGVAAIVQRLAPGLDGAVREGLAELKRAGVQQVLVVMNDLPMARPEDLAGVAAAMREHDVVLCPSGSGTGTNAVGMPAAAPLRLRFGGPSLSRVRDEASRAGFAPVLHHNARIALDIDTPRDLLQWLRSELVVDELRANRRLHGVLRDVERLAARSLPADANQLAAARLP
jgi:2-phospho-L-lactate guanylyltransferase